MLVFVIPVRHAASCPDVPTLVANLRRTLRSVCAQDHPAFRVVVVGSGLPSFPLPPGAERIEVGFAPPTPGRTPTVPDIVLHRDKGLRLVAGCLYARRYAPEYAMFVDADDLISRRLAGWVAERPGQPGWLCRESWVYRDGGQHVKLFGDFHRICGTSVILRFADLPLPDLPWDAPEEALRGAMHPADLVGMYGDHRAQEALCKVHGRDLATLPFPGVVYIQGNGTNNLKLRGAWGNVPLGTELCAEFALDMPPPDPVRAVSERLRHGYGKLRGFGGALAAFLRGW